MFIATAMLLACQNKGKEAVKQGGGDSVDPVEATKRSFDNPIDSIVHSTQVDTRVAEVLKYLSSHPDFVNCSKSIGYNTIDGEVYSDYMLWKDCGEVRVYTIPLESNYTTCFYNIVQYREDKGVIDTVSLQNIDEGMNDLLEIKSKNEKTYYLLTTDQYIEHQGSILIESIYAFSLGKDRLAKEKLFHTQNGQYDHIKVNCGGQRYCPLCFGQIDLVDLFNFEESDDAPTIVITNINENDWPTGDGLKYQWDGHCFQYVGKCKYDANGCYYE